MHHNRNYPWFYQRRNSYTIKLKEKNLILRHGNKISRGPFIWMQWPTRYPARIGTQATGRDHSIWEIKFITESWGMLKIFCLSLFIKCRQLCWVASLLLGWVSSSNLNLNGRGESWELNTASFWLVAAGWGRPRVGRNGGGVESCWAVAAVADGGEVATVGAACSEAAPICCRAASVGIKLWWHVVIMLQLWE